MQWYEDTAQVTVSLKNTNSTGKHVSGQFGRKRCTVFSNDSEIWSCELLNDVIPDQCKLRSAGKRLEIKLKKEKHGLWHGVGRVMEIDDVKVNSKEQQLPIKNGPQMQNHIQSVPQDHILHISGDTPKCTALSNLKDGVDSNKVIEVNNMIFRLPKLEPNDAVVVHLCVPHTDSQRCSVMFYELSLEVEFFTTDNSFLSKYNGTTSETCFQWKAKLKHAVQANLCSWSSCDTFIELKLFKSDKMTDWEPLFMDNATQEFPEKESTAMPFENELSNGLNDLNFMSEATVKDEHYISNDFNPFKLASQPVVGDDANVSLTPEKNEQLSDVRDNNNSTQDCNHLKEEESTPNTKTVHTPTFYYLPHPLTTSCSTGIANIGNTCFMNSVLQCLTNTVEFRDYFLGGLYKSDINLSNPLGHKGKLANAFASCMKELWANRESYIVPMKLKAVIGSISDRFVGYSQHDAHEFVTFLLDALHEDMNRVKSKPYYNKTDDEDVSASESWRRYKSRNNSVFVDLFGGQFKSTLVCPLCDKVSVTSDPFMSLSVPLPKKTRTLPVLFVPRNAEEMPRKLVLNLPPDGRVEILKASVSKRTGVPVSCLKVFEAYRGKFQALMTNNKFLSDIGDNDTIVVSEVLLKSEAKCDVKEIGVMMRLQYLPDIRKCSRKECGKLSSDVKRCTRCKMVAYCNRECQTMDWNEHKLKCKVNSTVPVGFPFIISLPTNQVTYAKITEIAEKFASQSLNYSRPVDTSLSESSVISGPMYYLLPVTSYGGSIPNAKPLEETNGNGLVNVEYLTMEWRNNPKDADHVEVSIKDDILQNISTTTTSSSKTNDDVDDCLQLFTEPEKLPKDNEWFCPRCKKLCEATKQLSIWKLPHVMIVHLKRFSFKNCMWLDKIDKLVSFPLYGLNMSSYLVQDSPSNHQPIYDLYGIVNHHGSIRRGHYTSIVKSPKPGSDDWYKYDDDEVSKVRNPSQNHLKDAYILFYKLRDQSNM